MKTEEKRECKRNWAYSRISLGTNKWVTEKWGIIRHENWVEWDYVTNRWVIEKWGIIRHENWIEWDWHENWIEWDYVTKLSWVL